MTFFLALHDLGKFSEGFQVQRSDLFAQLHGASTHRMFPTGVGMNRTTRSMATGTLHVPHECGDEPPLEQGFDRVNQHLHNLQRTAVRVIGR